MVILSFILLIAGLLTGMKYDVEKEMAVEKGVPIKTLSLHVSIVLIILSMIVFVFLV